MSSKGKTHRSVTVKVTSNKPPTSALTPASGAARRPTAPPKVKPTIERSTKKHVHRYDPAAYDKKQAKKLGCFGSLKLKMKRLARAATKPVISAPVRKRALGL